MKQLQFDEGVSLALDSLISQRLAIMCGAGLSMAKPSLVPNAATLAARAKEKYDATYGASRPELPPGIEEQADFFFQKGELATVYLQTYIDHHAFAGPFNEGHVSVADLLLVRGFRLAVSTNVDSMIETAASTLLYGQIGSGIDAIGVAGLPPDISPLLKIHGCWTSDKGNTVWTPTQLDKEPVASRIAGSKDWLKVQLLNRDIVIVGYFTDWDYLNTVLGQAIGAVNPSKVIVVDPSDSATLATKAPALFELGGRAAALFGHVRSSGDAFLTELRNGFSRSFIRLAISRGVATFKAKRSQSFEAAWLEVEQNDPTALWNMRRDLEGCRPRSPATCLSPPDEPLLGLTILELRAKGAQPDGPFWRLGKDRIRVLRTSNQLLHEVEARHDAEFAPTVAPDFTFAIGAESVGLRTDIVRGQNTGSIARSANCAWLSRSDAVERFSL